MKILADRNMAGVAEIFAGLGQVELFDGRDLVDLGGADILLVRSVTRVDGSLLGRHRPRFVGSATSGFDHIDRDALDRLGIPFAHAPGSNADSVVDYVLSALCHAGDRLPRLLAGEPLGIIGFGHIGRRLHARLSRLGVNCLAYDPWLAGEVSTALTTLDAVLACPVVALHASLTQQQPWPSYHMLDAAALGALPEGSLLINAGRGELLATGELLTLKERRPDIDLVLDVWEEEPAIDATLLDICRFGTAHIAGYSYDGKLRATAMLYEAACEALRVTAEAHPAPGHPVLLEAPDLAPAGLLCWLVTQIYDIRKDDRLMREAMPDGFDPLRKSYRRRRELGCIRVCNAASLDAGQRTLCEALGLEMATC